MWHDLYISFVIPCYNSESTLKNVVSEIVSTVSGKIPDYEIILVNDGSGDGTLNTIREIVESDKHVKGLDLARNFGQHSALMAGIKLCCGDIAICLDDDGQSPADEIGKLLDELDKGYDVVYARYQHKQHSLYRNLGSMLNGWMTEIMLGKPKGLYLSSFFAMRRFVIDEIVQYDRPYPYLMGLVLRTTDNIGNVDVTHRGRVSGESGYTFRKLLKLWLNGFTAFSVKPLRIATLSGFTLAALGILFGIWIVIKKIVFDVAPVGWSSLAAMIMFIGGMMMIMQGMVGEYIGRIYLSMNRNPQYVIRAVISHDSEED